MPSSTKDASLYGEPRPKKPRTGNPITTSSTLAFNTSLSDLISQSKSSQSTSSARPRPVSSSTTTNTTTSSTKTHEPSPKKSKPNLFTRPTKPPPIQDNHAPLSEPDYHNSRAALARKAALYDALQRGETFDSSDDALIDFDAKHDSAHPSATPTPSPHASDDELVPHTDEYGRSRPTSKRALRRARLAASLSATLARSSRPAAPARVLRGAGVQADAFRLEDEVEERMTTLAGKRDRSASPPPETHFDAKWEVRTKGTGFFGFSGEADERKEQMEGLEELRRETVAARGEEPGGGEGERERRMRERREAVEAKRRKITEKRGEVRAERFLDELGVELAGGEEKDEAAG